MAHSFEGYYKLQTRAGQELQNKLDSFSREEIENLDVGDRFVYLSDERMFQNAYEIVKVTKTEKKVADRVDGEYVYVHEELDNSDHKIVCTRLTKTGKKTSSRNFLSDHFQIDRGSLAWSISKYYDGVGYDIEEYKEQTKRWVATGKSRDTQKKHVYRAEWALKRNENIELSRFETIRDAQEYINDLLEDEVILEMFPEVKRNIKINWNGRLKNKARACYYEREIQLCTDSSKEFTLSKLTIIHEFAHFCAEDDLAGHGAEFTTAFLKLLKYLENDLYSELRNQYDYRDIDYNADELEENVAA